MNKKFLLVSIVTLLLGTTSVMADNHKHQDGPRQPKKEVVHKKDKKDKDRKSDRHFDSKGKHQPAKPVVHKAPKKSHPVAHRPHHKPHHKPNHKPACRPDGRHGKDCHHCHKSHCHNGSHCRPVAPRRPVVKHIRVTPPFSPFQVTVRI